MAQKTRLTLKGYFETGDIPNQNQYTDLIDSKLNLTDTGTQIVQGTISSSNFIVENNITSSGNISSSGIITGVTGTFTTLTNIDTTHITASGNISSSGYVYAHRIIGKTHSSGQTNNLSLGGDGRIDINPENITAVRFTSQSINFQKPVSSSKNISSSANIIANQITASGHILVQNSLNVNKDIQVRHITASGNISSSGTIAANNLSLGGISITPTATEINYLDGVVSDVKEAYDGISYDNNTGIITMTEIDGGTDTIDIGVGTADTPTFRGLNTSLEREDAHVFEWGGSLDIGSKRNFSISFAAPIILANSVSSLQAITSNAMNGNSIILATCNIDLLVVHTYYLESETLSFRLFNPHLVKLGAALGARINFIII